MQVIFSDVSQIVIGQNNRVYMWPSANEAYSPECMCLPVQFLCLFVWGFRPTRESNGDVNIAGERLQILSHARHSGPWSSEGF